MEIGQLEYKYGNISSSINVEVFMPIVKLLPNILNGFTVVKDLGLHDNGIRYATVICKECNQEFDTSVYHINIIKSCGCLPCNPPKKLPNEINGFKILKDLGYTNGSRRAIAICKECKKEYEVDPNKLKYRKHCGCMKKEVVASKYAKSHPRLNNIFKHMMSRCYNQKNQDYYLYGKKGIRICREWKNDRNKFFEWSINNGYQDSLTIDRINNKKGYNPENCRWTTIVIQSRNTKRVKLNMEIARSIRKDSQYFTQDELSKLYDVSKATIGFIMTNKTWKE